MRRQRLTQVDMAKNIGVSQASVSDYLIGELKPPLHHLTAMADVLDLTGQERVTFFEEAHLAHAPERVRDIVADLRSEVARMAKLCRQNGINVTRLP
jgi:transcriptional regulator with XRE-family HTH domain